MGGLMSALNAGKTALGTNQKAVEIAGNNIANVNTPGYSRQVAVFNPVPSLELNGYFIGQGVNIDAIAREHDVFLTRQIHNKAAVLGEESGRSTPMAELERIFSIGDNSIATEVDRFFDAWAELSTNPAGQTERQIVVQRGELLAEQFNATVTDLRQAQNNINASVESMVTAINPKLQEIADLNLRISTIEISGQGANSDRDRRDMLLEDVSKALGATYYEERGMVSVQLPGGMPLVQDTAAMQLEGYYDTSNNLQLRLKAGSSTIDVPLRNLGGEFKGVMSVRDEFIPARIAELDHLAYGIATAVNAQHVGGVQLDGSAASEFFGPVPLVESGFAKAMKMNLTSGAEVAAGTGGALGDNTNALAVVKLRDSLTAIDGADSFTGFYSKIASKVGIEANRSALTLGGTEDAMVQLRNMRDAAVGVSLEEEMINLMQYQKGFEASAKYLSTINELMDTLLSLKR
ncbi:MAG: flagellar hook-associated protein FlgK [Trichloromonadaceae bacterium]